VGGYCKKAHKAYAEIGVAEWTAVNKHIPGELIIMPPTGKESGMRNSDINIELGLWNRQTN
jgi:Uma2 family endonuclease